MLPVYDQKGGTCGGFAIAGLIQHIFRTPVFEEEVYNLYKKHDTDNREGLRTSDILEILKTEKLGGHSVKSWSQIFNARIPTKRNKHLIMPRIRRALKTPKTGLILGINLRKEKPHIKLDHSKIFIPDSDTHGEPHVMFIEDLWEKGVKLRNSWGSDFGQNGSFFMKTEDLLKHVDGLFLVMFE